MQRLLYLLLTALLLGLMPATAPASEAGSKIAPALVAEAVILAENSCIRCVSCQNRCVRLWQGMCSGSSCAGGYQRCVDRCAFRFCVFCWVPTVVPAAPPAS
jgi:hypothetical protein